MYRISVLGWQVVVCLIGSDRPGEIRFADPAYISWDKLRSLNLVWIENNIKISNIAGVKIGTKFYLQL